jgi:hypothetical protein
MEIDRRMLETMNICLIHQQTHNYMKIQLLVRIREEVKENSLKASELMEQSENKETMQSI